MNKYNAMRLFRQFSLIGCRGFFHAPGAAHLNLSNYTFFQILSIFPPSFAHSALFTMLLNICVSVIIGQMPFQETPAWYNNSRKTSRLFLI